MDLGVRPRPALSINMSAPAGVDVIMIIGVPVPADSTSLITQLDFVSVFSIIGVAAPELLTFNAS